MVSGSGSMGVPPLAGFWRTQFIGGTSLACTPLDYLAFSEVLPRCAVLVHHGGIGTTAQAIAAGIPQVIRPMAHDQPDNAARVEKLGVGASLSPPKFNAVSLAEQLNALLTSQAVLDRCRTCAERIDPEQSLNDTCAAIEDFYRNQLK